MLCTLRPKCASLVCRVESSVAATSSRVRFGGVRSNLGEKKLPRKRLHSPLEVRSVVAVPTRSLKAVTDAKVTCTESLRQGQLPHVPPSFLCGTLFWELGAAKLMEPTVASALGESRASQNEV